jgi:hypothetical protein
MQHPGLTICAPQHKLILVAQASPVLHALLGRFLPRLGPLFAAAFFLSIRAVDLKNKAFLG